MPSCPAPGVLVEQPAVQRTHGEAVALRRLADGWLGAGIAQQVFLRVEAVVDEAEQLLDGEVRAVALGFLGVHQRAL